MRPLLVALALFTAGCTRHAGPASDADAGESGDDNHCGNITVLRQVMKCEMAPFMSGQTGDEAAFRKALEQVRDLAPSDPEFMSGPRPWPQIAQGMLDSRSYKQGCAECHRAYLKLYRAKYQDSQIPWTDVHAAAAPAK